MFVGKQGGKLFNNLFFDQWKKAFTKAQIPYRRLYALRHTFAAWTLLLGIRHNRLDDLLGHGGMKMINEVYGKHVTDLEKDFDKVRNYFGDNFC